MTLLSRFAKLRILLAEDNDINQRVALLQLQNLGCAAEVVQDGIGALEALRKNPCDILFLDCQMPRLDGYQTAREIRRLEQAAAKPGTTVPRVQIIAMTAYAMQGDREKCLAAGMDDYISKPVRAADLLAALERAARHASPPADLTPTPS